jgi:hypothetical protein
MMKRTKFLLALIALFLITSSALAMGSDNYRLDWFTPLTGSGGAASSTNYAVNFTVGQAVVGVPSSAHYGGCLGYWCEEGSAGAPKGYHIYLPAALKGYPSP